MIFYYPKETNTFFDITLREYCIVFQVKSNVTCVFSMLENGMKNKALL